MGQDPAGTGYGAGSPQAPGGAVPHGIGGAAPGAWGGGAGYGPWRWMWHIRGRILPSHSWCPGSRRHGSHGPNRPAADESVGAPYGRGSSRKGLFGLEHGPVGPGPGTAGAGKDHQVRARCGGDNGTSSGSSSTSTNSALYHHKFRSRYTTSRVYTLTDIKQCKTSTVSDTTYMLTLAAVCSSI